MKRQNFIKRWFNNVVDRISRAFRGFINFWRKDTTIAYLKVWATVYITLSALSGLVWIIVEIIKNFGLIASMAGIIFVITTVLTTDYVKYLFKERGD